MEIIQKITQNICLYRVFFCEAPKDELYDKIQWLIVRI